MAQVNVLYEGGAAGDTISAANSGVTTVGGNSGGNTAVLSAADAAHGNLGGRYTTVAGGNAAGVFATINYPTTSGQQTLSTVIRMINALPAVDTTIMSWRDSANATMLRLFIRASDNGLYLADASGTYTLIATSAQYSLNTKYRFTLTAATGASASTGSFTAKLRLQSTQAQVGTTATSTTATLNLNGFFRVITGIIGNVLGYNIGFDDTQINSGTLTEIGDYAPPANVPPTAAFTYTKTNLTLNVDASASSDSDGTVTGYGWNFGDGAGTQAVGQTATHVYTTPGTYTVTLAVADNAGASTTTSQSIVVAAGAPVAVVNALYGQVIIDLTASTGAGPFTYDIDPLPVDAVNPGGNSAVFAWAQTANAQTYVATVTDNSGQQDTQTFSVPGATTSGGSQSATLTETVVYKNGQWV